MWPELEEEVEVERLALAAMLHAFYNGVENIFKRIAYHCDGGVSKSSTWHQELLASMASGNYSPPPVISESLRTKLRPYLDFRHFFRHCYSFQIRWAKMEGLVQKHEPVFKQFQGELKEFLDQE